MAIPSTQPNPWGLNDREVQVLDAMIATGCMKRALDVCCMSEANYGHWTTSAKRKAEAHGVPTGRLSYLLAWDRFRRDQAMVDTTPQATTPQTSAMQAAKPAPATAPDDIAKALAYYRACSRREFPEWVPHAIDLLQETFGDGPFRGAGAPAGKHPCHVNALGAVSIKDRSGAMLGLRPHEFEVIEWRRATSGGAA